MDFDENADHGDGDHEDGEGNLDDIFAGGDENNVIPAIETRDNFLYGSVGRRRCSQVYEGLRHLFG